jgi:hypothetical protein
MSDIPTGGSGIFIGAHATTGTFNLHRSSSGWPGDAIIQAEALNTGAPLLVTQSGTSRGSDGVFNFGFHVQNTGANSTFFNIQVSFN